MAITNPLGISNSSNKKYCNLFGTISKDNYNIVLASMSSYDYYASVKKQPHLASNKYPNYKPKTIDEVIRSTGLLN